MDLFESLQLMEESRISVDEYFDNLTTDIYEKYGCDIDDTYYDDSYPTEFKASFVLYNISDDEVDEIKNSIINHVSKEFKNVRVEYECDDKYLSDIVNTAYTYIIQADNADFDFD